MKKFVLLGIALLALLIPATSAHHYGHGSHYDRTYNYYSYNYYYDYPYRSVGYYYHYPSYRSYTYYDRPRYHYRYPTYYYDRPRCYYSCYW